MTRSKSWTKLTRGESDEYDRRYDDIETTRRLEAVARNRIHHEAERARRAARTGAFGFIRRLRRRPAA